MKESISIGIMAYNEEQNIGNLLSNLLNQKLINYTLKEIIVISSNSIDKTNQIVKEFSRKSKKVKLFTENQRHGKYSSINLFLCHAQSDILVLESADTIPKQGTIDKLCKPFQTNAIGIVAARPIPITEHKSSIDYIVELQWKLLHRISLKNPKYGELIAFRKVFTKIRPTAVDEEEIAFLIKQKGYKGIYISDAIVYNKGPTNVRDFIRQRRRIFVGHLTLRKKENYVVPTLNPFRIFIYFIQELKFKFLIWQICALFLEGISRFLGLIDYYILKKDHYIWSVSKSTKQRICQKH